MTHASTEARIAVDTGLARTTWLSGLRVVCAGDSLPLQIAGRTLSQMGAEIVAISPRNAAGAAAELAGYDVVLVDRIEEAKDLPGLPAGRVGDYLEFVAEHNRAVWVTASAFGLADARADAFVSELTLLAAGGILGHSSSGDDLPPTIPAGSIGLKLVGNVIAVAALHGVHANRSGNGPLHVDVSAQGSVIATGLSLEMGHALANCPNEGGSARYGAPTGFFSCTDGSVYVLVLEQHQWTGFREVLAPELDSVPTLEDARQRAEEVNAAMATWASTRTTSECEHILQAAGVPCTTVNTVETFIERAHAVGRPLDLTGPSAAALPALVNEVPEKQPEGRADGPIPLRDLRVLDAGHVLAVPLASAWLGAMGAQVTKLEDPARLDVYRRRGPFASGIPGLNRSGYFNHINFCKASLDVQVDASGSSLNIEPYDVIVNNLSPHRARRVGVDAASVSTAMSPKLQLSSSGFGLTGELAGYRAYGTNIHAFSGLVAASQNARGEMASVGTPWADPLTSVAITAWILAWSLASERWSTVTVDLSMAEVLAAQLVELMGHGPDDTYQPADVGGDFFLSIPGTGRRLAVTLADADDVDKFEALTGSRLPSLQRRGQLLELALGPLADMDDEALQRHLLAAGLRVSIVYTAYDLAKQQELRDNELFQAVESSALGRYFVTGLPWRFAGRAKSPLTAAPERPENNGV